MVHRGLWILAALVAAVIGVSAKAEASDGDLLVRNARVFDGEKSLGVRDVLVRRGLIVRVGRRLSAPRGVATIDGKGKTLMPGLMDSHVHVFPSAAEDALRFGVTTEFDMFTLATSDQIATRHANRASFDRTDSADVWSAGNGVTPPGGHPTAIAKGAGMELRTLAEGMDAAAFIKTQVDEGSDYIKIFQEDGGALNPKPTLPRFADHRLKQLIDLSHSTGRKAIVHVSKMSDARDAFQFGADAIAHMWMDQEVDDTTLDAIKARGGVVIATLSVLASISGDPAPKELATDPAIAPHLSPTQSAMLSAGFKKIHPDLLERSLRNVRRLHRAGVTILAGTDASNPGTAHGPSIHEEMELLVRAGMTPSEAIAASTAKPAAFFGTADRGRIATGLRADLLLVDGDPTVDIKATRRIVGIWKNGYPVDRAKLPVIPSMPGAK